MDRRKFLKTTGTFIAGATIARSALANAATEPTAVQGRLVLPINRNWRLQPHGRGRRTCARFRRLRI